MKGIRNGTILLFALVGCLILPSIGCSSGGSNGTAPLPPSTAKDTTPPVITATFPGQLQYDTPITDVLSATFSELIDCATVTASTFTLSDTTYQKTVPGTVSCNGSTITFTANEPLSAANDYSVTLSTDIADLAGNHLTAPFTWSFETVRINSNLFSDPVVYNMFLYSRPPAPEASYQARAVATGDVNGDGLNDVVLTTDQNQYSPNDYRIFVFLQNATTHELNWPTAYLAGNGNSIDIGDVNNDGRNDVVVTAQGGIGVFLQDGSGGLASMITYSSAIAGGPENTWLVRIGDFNHDGRMDIAAIDDPRYCQGLDIFFQNNSGALNSAITYSVGSAYSGGLDIGDLNHDGLTDIGMSAGDLLQDNVGKMQAPELYPSDQSIMGGDTAIGDVNGDGLDDIVVTDRLHNRIYVYLQNQSGSFDAPVWYQTARLLPSAVVIADVNNDGRNDVIVLHDGWEGLGVHLQAGDGTLLPAELYGIPYASSYLPHALAVADINGDGKKDVVIADYNNGLIILYHK